MKLLYLLSAILLFIINASAQSHKEAKAQVSDTTYQLNTIRADFIKILPHQASIITDLSKSLSTRELSNLNSLWENFYKTSKKGIATMVLDSGRIGSNDFNEFAEAIYSTWAVSEKSDAVYIVISPSLRKAMIFKGPGLSSFLNYNDVNLIIQESVNPQLQRNNLYQALKNAHLAIIKKIKSNGG